MFRAPREVIPHVLGVRCHNQLTSTLLNDYIVKHLDDLRGHCAVDVEVGFVDDRDPTRAEERDHKTKQEEHLPFA
jgi:hypothetical protein